jgi:hypothetical protein
MYISLFDQTSIPNKKGVIDAIPGVCVFNPGYGFQWFLLFPSANSLQFSFNKKQG